MFSPDCDPDSQKSGNLHAGFLLDDLLFKKIKAVLLEVYLACEKIGRGTKEPERERVGVYWFAMACLAGSFAACDTEAT
jgi:hypothetical protein